MSNVYSSHVWWPSDTHQPRPLPAYLYVGIIARVHITAVAVQRDSNAIFIYFYTHTNPPVECDVVVAMRQHIFDTDIHCMWGCMCTSWTKRTASQLPRLFPFTNIRAPIVPVSIINTRCVYLYSVLVAGLWRFSMFALSICATDEHADTHHIWRCADVPSSVKKVTRVTREWMSVCVCLFMCMCVCVYESVSQWFTRLE